MNITKYVLISTVAASTAFAQPPHFEIDARYEGFSPSLLADLSTEPNKSSPSGVLAAPRVTTKAGQTAVIEIGRETVLPTTIDGKAPSGPRSPFNITATNARGETTVDGRKTAFCGVSLEVSPEIKDGQIVLSGKSTIRSLLQPGSPQPLNAVSFSTRETVFSDKVSDGETIVVRVGDGPADKSQITLTVRMVASK
jgi:type II secretory pathway component HofQ